MKILGFVMLFATGVIQVSPNPRAASHPSGCTLTTSPFSVDFDDAYVRVH